MSLLEMAYVLLAAWLAVYGLNSLLLTVVYVWARRRETPTVPEPDRWPSVTVQLPIYNELHVVKRLVAAAVALDYPRELLQIQVLDDSTDSTRMVAQRAVDRYARMGVDIHYLRRSTREGFKAGALAYGLRQATGELIAIFDADFLPPRDFLRRVVPHFSAPEVGCVQARWDHLNRSYSALTRAQALGVDAHFAVEQRARSAAGLFLNFNGSAGVWRRVCVKDAGGWHAETLTEDLDLSYRAQLAGWRILYLPNVRVPGELPPQFDALRRQQARWAQGSIQVARKVLPLLLRSDRPWHVKLQGAIHLTGYLVHPLLLVTLLLTLPLVLTGSLVSVFVPYFLLATAGPPLMCLAALHERGSERWRELRFAPLLLLIGMGLALNNSVAMLRGLLGQRGEFQRTPKFAVRYSVDGWRRSTYALRCTRLVWSELSLAAFALTSAVLAYRGPARSLSYWLTAYALAYACTAGMSLVQSVSASRGEVTMPSSWDAGRQSRSGQWADSKSGQDAD
jgi:cellulose synthase/poly-beta-1,6-N-acetylglucosamine synthase-like glycosyltransferase